MKLVLESVGTVKGKIVEGTALVPTISLNGNVYTREAILATQNIGVELDADWEHTDEKVGKVVYTLDETGPTINYRAEITSERANELKEGVHKVSIEADVEEAVKSCTRSRCYNLVEGIKMTGIGITETPGVPQVTLKFTESFQEWQPITEKNCDHCIVKEEDLQSKIKELEKQVYNLTHCQNCGKLKKTRKN